MPMLLVLVLLQSRAAIIALGVGLIVYATFYRRWVLPLALVALVIAGMLHNAYPPAHAIGSPFIDPLLASLRFRQELFGHAFSLFLESPVLGTGLAAYPIIAARDFPIVLGDPTTSHSHNLYLQVALDTGIMGVIAFAVICIIAARLLWRAYRAGVEKDLAIGYLSALVVLLAHGVVDQITWGTKPGLVLWLLLGVAVAIDKLAQAQRIVPAPRGTKTSQAVTNH
jgi:putative inorganic carbon (HCO3(-)) transporter